MERFDEKDLTEAREWLRRRVEAELSMQDNAEAVIALAAERIVAICYRYCANPERLDIDSDPRMSEEVDEVLQWLRGALEDMLHTLATYADTENRDGIWGWVTRRRDGETFGERLDGYIGNFRRELALLAGAGLFLGLSEKAAADSIRRNLHKPWSNPELADGVAAPLSYGRGRTSSMATAMTALARWGVAEGWMRARHEKAVKREAAGFWTFRNSSVPCDMCDSYAEVFHLMDDPIPPIHGHCVCGTVYVDGMGVPIGF